MECVTPCRVGVHWFRHGLRLHDNPALLELLRECDVFVPIFIFDGATGLSGASKVSYNRMRFLLECLADLNSQLSNYGGCLYILHGEPTDVLRRIKHTIGLHRLSFDEDYEPIWHRRDAAVRQFCQQENVQTIERGSHTLWDPRMVVKTNGGVAPLTYQMFLHTVRVLGPPPRPVEDVSLLNVTFGQISSSFSTDSVKIHHGVPTPEELGVHPETGLGERMVRWEGGETKALRQLEERAAVEGTAFRQGQYLPNQAQPDLLGPPTSMSAALSTGCLSVRRFYWRIHDLYSTIHHGHEAACENITGQLVWREYFYTMSLGNPNYDRVEGNSICLDIPWRNSQDKTTREMMERWRQGKTGYPFIDAAIRQMKQEGWIHHVARNAIACFLTRGDLWISWVEGLQFFLEQLIDADWSVCAGNWLWVSSSAFEQLLDCDQCVCPVNFGRRLDPWGHYVKRYVPEVEHLPVKYIYEPWKASLEEQEKAKCVIGRDYPERIVNHQQASQANRQMMVRIRDSMVESRPQHCCPSSVEEVRQFMWLPDQYSGHTHV
ncbi:cryptochrome-1 [Macrosteles quadrilineatus]|uniref:cryptochrome-1 n=1 Tax=Macrosteles quadrilineatus TaxID=74068 RepID=UPI0023E34C5E|nr:cryptochrome-1 [Macrosteles quadrilineatus]